MMKEGLGSVEPVGSRTAGPAVAPAGGVPGLLAEGVRRHQAGEIAVARALYERILALDPRQPDALHLLGLILHQTGEHARGAELIQKAIRRNDRVAYYHSNLGECWRALGEWDRAVACYRRALRLDPKSADAHANLGNVSRSRKCYAEAVAYFRRALELRAGDAGNLANLGGTLCELGRPEEALEPCRDSVRLAPQVFEGWLSLGVALWRLERNQDALDPLRRAITLRPGNADALDFYAGALHRLGRSQEALAVLKTAIEHNPDDPHPHSNLGSVLMDLGAYEKAERAFQASLKLKPDLPSTWNNLGLVAFKSGAPLLARQRLQRALELSPHDGAALTNLGEVWRMMAEPERALDCFRQALAAGDTHGKAAHNLLFTIQFTDTHSPEEICAEAQKWGEEKMAKVPAVPRPANQISSARRMRIGYVSPDFALHPVAYFMLGLLGSHDRSKFEIYCYSDMAQENDGTKRVRERVEHWVPIYGRSDDEVSEQVRRDGIDLLIDLTGHTARNRLGVFARQPARRQATYLGYPGSTGLRTVDFRISDPWADPPEVSQGHYVEELALLDRPAWCYEPPVHVPVQAIPPSAVLGNVTFGCFNNYTKMGNALLEIWAGLMQAVPGARLLLKAAAFGEEEFAQLTRERFRSHGIDPARLLLRSRTEAFADHFASYNEIDIALDTYPYHGTTTTCDALWMGVPVVTRRGNRHASRVGVSLLHAVGLDELIADNADDYVRIAAGLAANPLRLQELRAGLRERMVKSELMDPQGFARSFEALVRRMLDVPEAGPGEAVG